MQNSGCVKERVMYACGEFGLDWLEKSRLKHCPVIDSARNIDCYYYGIYRLNINVPSTIRDI